MHVTPPAATAFAIVGRLPINTPKDPKAPMPDRDVFAFMLTSTVPQEQNPPSVTIRDSGHQPVQNALACEVSSPVSRGKVQARIRPDIFL
jgi:hypothetical protein